MDDQMHSSRPERREEIKLRLEYLKTAVSAVGIMAIMLATLQWRQANLIANEGAYHRMTTEWRSHLETFIERPELRPYFYDDKPLQDNDPNRDAALAIAIIRLEAIDAALTTAMRRWSDAEILGWRLTFTRAFADSPVLCKLISEHWEEYGFTRQVALTGCGGGIIIKSS